MRAVSHSGHPPPAPWGRFWRCLLRPGQGSVGPSVRMGHRRRVIFANWTGGYVSRIPELSMPVLQDPLACDCADSSYDELVSMESASSSARVMSESESLSSNCAVKA